MSYIYTFIREDIPNEQKIVQLGHACHEAGKRTKDSSISSLILLSAKDEEDLISISQRLDARGIEFQIFFEPDNGMGYSALCSEPISCPTDRSFFRKWKLFSF